tara:strand:+ start:246 stop:644 length:399 start_codon:yes stop_codon:yes gene_type:complete
MRQIEVSNYIYVLIMLIVFGCSTVMSQEFVGNDNFKSTIAKDIVAVEFWAEWNSANEFKDLINLKDCEVYRVDISSNMDTQLKYNVSAIPTVIVFENGTEQARFNANVMFKLEADKKLVQHSVDTLILNKFQ